MLDILNYIPEIILLVTLLTCSLFLIKKPISKKNSRFLDASAIIGLAACASYIILSMIEDQQSLIRDLFKLYFLLAATYHMFTYSKRFHALERVCLLSTCLGLFMIVSTTDTLMLLSSFALCIVSVYGFSLTRERPSKDTAMLVSILFLISIIYGQNHFMAAMILLLSTLFFALRTTNKDLESFCVTLLVPINIYILLRELLASQNPIKIESTLITIGFILMLLPVVLLFSGSNKTKNMVKFAVFYIGAILFLLGSGTLDIKASAIMMTLLLTFTYSPVANPLTIIGMVLLPPATAFVGKFPLFWAPFKNEEPVQIILLSAITLAMSIFGARELYNFHTSNKGKLVPFSTPFKIISIAVIIVSVIYFSYINQTLEYAIRALSK